MIIKATTTSGVGLIFLLAVNLALMGVLLYAGTRIVRFGWTGHWGF
jgi:hypothetical protein